jgi:outer membrane protein insertion porin family
MENINVDSVRSNAPTEIQSVKGTNALAGVKFGIRRELVDNRFNPSTGHSFNAGYEQLGGDYTFGLLSGAYRRYKTLYKDLAERKTILATKLLAATVIGDAPLFEKFYAGGTGIHGIRGFDYRGVSTRAGVNKDPIGSDWMFLANAEVTVPLVGKKFAALFFVDSGAIDSGGYRAAVGTGIQILIPRWFGPVPMRLEIAVPLMRDDADDTQVFSFSVGRLF